MKTVNKPTSKSSELRIKKDSGSKVSKHRYDENAEMQASFLKLEQLVPGLGKGKVCSQMQLLQNVMEYILDLQEILDPNTEVPVTPATPCPDFTNLLPLVSRLSVR
ncbi:hypothetical protein ScPMuIL_005632 [Solemya velum]